MSYKLVLTKRTLRRLEKLDRNRKEEVVRALEEITENPLRFKALRYELKGYRSARVGKLRIIFRIDGEDIVVVSIEHRKKVYKGID